MPLMTSCSTCSKSCMCVVINLAGFVCDLALNVYPVIREVPVSFIVLPRVSAPFNFRPEGYSEIGVYPL